jgi:undecaprenyl-diphosphatase
VHGLDIRIFHAINGWSSQWRPLYVFFSEATKQTPVRIGILIIIALLIAAGRTTRKAALLALASIAVSDMFSNGIKNAFPMERPCVELHDVILRVGMLDSFGTASSHSANMAALAFVMVYHFKWFGAPWILVALLTGLSRIYVGVHYPSQVLLGYLVGLFSAFLVIKTWEAFVKLRQGRRSLDAVSESGTT